jgi:dUTPase
MHFLRHLRKLNDFQWINTEMHIKIQRTSTNAQIPRQNPDSTYDIYSCVKTTIPSGECSIVDTGIIISVPQGSYARIESVELSVSHNIETSSFCSLGYHDNKFTPKGDRPKNVQIVLRNHGAMPYAVKVGDVIGRLVVYRTQLLEIKEYDDIKEESQYQVEYGPSLKSIPKHAKTWFVRLWKSNPTYVKERYLTKFNKKDIEDFHETDMYKSAEDQITVEANFIWSRLNKPARIAVQTDFRDVQVKALGGNVEEQDEIEESESSDEDEVPTPPVKHSKPVKLGKKIAKRPAKAKGKSAPIASSYRRSALSDNSDEESS